jgi:hypothetical protein
LAHAPRPTGFRVRGGWSPPDVRAGVRRARAHTCIGPSELSEAWAIRVLGVGDTLLSAQRAHARRNLAHIAAFINQAQRRLSWVPPAEGSVGFVKYAAGCRQPSSPGDLRIGGTRWGVQGICFGYEQHFGVGFGGDSATLLQGLRRLRNFVPESLPCRPAFPRFRVAAGRQSSSNSATCCG